MLWHNAFVNVICYQFCMVISYSVLGTVKAEAKAFRSLGLPYIQVAHQGQRSAILIDVETLNAAIPAFMPLLLLQLPTVFTPWSM